jgi:hypothetical protein
MNNCQYIFVNWIVISSTNNKKKLVTIYQYFVIYILLSHFKYEFVCGEDDVAINYPQFHKMSTSEWPQVKKDS